MGRLGAHWNGGAHGKGGICLCPGFAPSLKVGKGLEELVGISDNSASKSKKQITVFAVPHGESTLHRLHLPAWLLNRRVRYGAAVGAGLLAIHYAVSIYCSFLLPGLLAENSKLRDRVAELSTRAETVQGQIDRIEMLDHRVRYILGIEEQPLGQTLSVGGPIGANPEAYGDLGPKDAAKLRHLDASVQSLTEQAYIQEQRLEDLLDYFSEQRSQLASTPSVWPVRGWVTSGFGHRQDPFTGEQRAHEGLDISANIGATVAAPADGVVVFAGARGGYGKVTTLDHGYGLMTTYGHLSEIRVREGQRISRGEVIAAVGNTGRSTGPHLHYEVLVNDVPVDPTKFILN